MKRVSNTLSMAVLVGVIAVGATSVRGAELTADELKCQIGANEAAAKFLAGLNNCAIKCVDAARKAGQDPHCGAPYTDPTESACIGAARAKGVAADMKACSKDCPECGAFHGDKCASTEPQMRMDSVQAQATGAGTLIFCAETDGPSGTNKDEAKCEDTTAKSLTKLVAAKDKCYEKCFAAEAKGKTTGSCLPAVDGKTAACIAKVKDKTKAAIDKRGADKPECCRIRAPRTAPTGRTSSAARSTSWCRRRSAARRAQRSSTRAAESTAPIDGGERTLAPLRRHLRRLCPARALTRRPLPWSEVAWQSRCPVRLPPRT